MTAMSTVSLPANLIAAVEADTTGRHRVWASRLDAVVGDIARRWQLVIDAPYEPGGQTSWVAPAVDRDDCAVVVKVVHRHPEAEAEAAGLRHWRGAGAVRLVNSELIDEDTAALLLERCDPGTTLATLDEPAQDKVVARLLRRLWAVPVPVADAGGDHSAPPFPTLVAMADLWIAGFDEAAAATPSGLDPGIVRAGLDLFRQLSRDTTTKTLLCTDLHAENILAAEREPWLVIDPKPHVGDPAYDVLQHMLNCRQRLTADPAGLAHRMADLAGLDRERVEQCRFARTVQQSMRWRDLEVIATSLAR